MPEKSPVSQHFGNPAFWIVVFVFSAAAMISIIDVQKAVFGRDSGLTGLKGELAMLEGALGQDKLLKCSAQDGCPERASCIEGYCVSGSTGSGSGGKSGFGITGAVVGVESLFGKPHLVKCESNFGCKNSVCRQGFCVAEVSGITGMSVSSVSDYCGSDSSSPECKCNSDEKKTEFSVSSVIGACGASCHKDGWFDYPISLPGSGEVQAESDFVLGGFLHQSIWRGNKGYYRSIPVDVNGPQFSSSIPWNGPVELTGLPGSGPVQAQSELVLGDVLYQSIWRNNVGYTKTNKISGSNVLYSDDWKNVADLSSVPGSGEMEAQNEFVVGDDNFMYQGIWRGEVGWFRDGNIVVDPSTKNIMWSSIKWTNLNEDKTFEKAGANTDNPETTFIQGKGATQTKSDFVAGFYLYQTYFRGNKGYYRRVPLVMVEGHLRPDFQSPLGKSGCSGGLVCSDLVCLPSSCAQQGQGCSCPSSASASSATHFKCEPLVKVQVSSSKSCVGFCGGKSSFGCYCDSVCSKYGDCCPDYQSVCSSKPSPECIEDSDCSVQCFQAPCPVGKCASGKCVQADSGQPKAKSCVGFCGGKSSFGCYCDSVCSKYGDCCPDYAVVCSVKK